ncbi:hypothetical protein QAD02_018046 [Eretmocerus hayati]|uniref:Uncharacterized protein n=1 Tax=Eretmocerus hayati TaxID=131215 RepID=A0ACC2PFA5_9HYME|nr:hypothetical protein QAD02_018046 [Eretmocerus hayati]
MIVNAPSNINEQSELLHYDLTVRAAVDLHREAEVYQLRPAPPIAPGVDPGFRFILQRVAADHQPVVPAARANDEDQLQQPAQEEAVQSPDEAIWQVIRRAVSGDEPPNAE